MNMDNESNWKSEVWIDKTIDLESGGEWHSGIMEIKEGSIVTVDLLSNERVYFKISKYKEYEIKTKGGIRPYEFPFGSDLKIIDESVKIPSTENYILIMRLSIFNASARVKLKVVVISPSSEV